MLKHLRGLFSQDLAIDLGTTNTRIHKHGAGIILNQPSIVAMDRQCGKRSVEKIVTAGLKAQNLLAQEDTHLIAAHPLQAGVIAQLNATEVMLQQFLGELGGQMFIKPSPRVLVPVPCNSTPLERRAVRESLLRAGARKVFLIEQPLAAAIGSGIPVSESRGTMILHLGGGICEVAVVCLNGIAYSAALRMGGDDLTETIAHHIRHNYKIALDPMTPTQVKHEIGCASQSSETRQLQIQGRRLKDDEPCQVTLDSDEIFTVLQQQIAQITALLSNAIDTIDPELLSDATETGVLLTGGSALLRDLDRLLADRTAINVFIADDPAMCVIKGCGRLLELADSHALEAFASGSNP